MNSDEILGWLLEENQDRLEILWERADSVRQKSVGNEVHIRGLIEFSNFCRSDCLYCGMRRSRRFLSRYRMTLDEIILSAREAARRGYGTVVLQSGEDPGLDIAWLAEIIKSIKRETRLAVTLSCGERSVDELARLREAGADRYYLRFETSDRMLWKSIHPLSKGFTHRLDLLPKIKEIGYETGSGIMVGIPGQTWMSLAEDLRWFRCLDLDMIGCGPYVPHPATPLYQMHFRRPASNPHGQVPNTILAACKVMALARLLCPNANIPSTTALATLSPELGYCLGLRRGANVLMVNLTPVEYRSLYEIYPAKAGIGESPQAQKGQVEAMLSGLGRIAGEGAGISPNYRVHRREAEF
jgi:biotin synthase